MAGFAMRLLATQLLAVLFLVVGGVNDEQGAANCGWTSDTDLGFGSCEGAKVVLLSPFPDWCRSRVYIEELIIGCKVQFLNLVNLERVRVLRISHEVDASLGLPELKRVDELVHITIHSQTPIPILFPVLHTVGSLVIDGPGKEPGLSGNTDAHDNFRFVQLESVTGEIVIRDTRYPSTPSSTWFRDGRRIGSNGKALPFEILRSAEKLTLQNLPGLTTLSPLKSLVYVGEVLVEGASLQSLEGLGAVERCRSFEVKEPYGGSRMSFLGGPFAANARVDRLVIGQGLWPKCITPHERDVLLSLVPSLGRADLPAATKEWWQQQCDLDYWEPFRCVAGRTCTVFFDVSDQSPLQIAVERFFLSGRSKGCGACPTITYEASGQEVNFGRLDIQTGVGMQSICRCKNKAALGPLAELFLRGPLYSDLPLADCIRGRSCTVPVTGADLLPTDRVVLVRSSCVNASDSTGYVAKWTAVRDDAATHEFVLGEDTVGWFAAPVAVGPGLKVCWRDSAEGSDFLTVGEVILRGPYPQSEKMVLGQGGFRVGNTAGAIEKDGDRMRIMRTCGVEDGNKPLEAVSLNGYFDFGEVAVDRAVAGSQQLCWCHWSDADSNSCNDTRKFGAESGTVLFLCPKDYELVPGSAICTGCPAGRSKAKDGNGRCSACEAGRFSQQGGLCEPCQSGTIAAEEGSSACVPCQPHENSSKAISCTPDPQMLGLMVLFAVLVCIICTILVRSIARQLHVADVSPDLDRTIVTTSRPHSFTNFGRMKGFPVTFRDTGHPGLDSPSKPFRITVTDSARFELLTWEGKSVNSRLDSSMGTLSVAFPYDLLHQGWPLPFVASMPMLLIAAATLAGVLVQAQAMTTELVVGTAAVALASVGFTAGMRMGRGATPLTQHLSAFKRDLEQTDAIHAEGCDKGPARALAVGKLLQLLEFFRDLIRDRNAYYLTSNILVPLTKDTQLSYAEFIGPGQVQWFVSHFWGTAYEHFCTALQKHAESTCGREDDWTQLHYWVCFCSNNQHKILDELGAGWQESSFYITLRSGRCRGTCMVLDDKALPLTRIWCIFELMQTVNLQHTQHDFRGLLMCTSGGVLNNGSGSVEVAVALAKRVANMDLASAEASSENDKKMIRDEVVRVMGSFAALNRFVCREVRDMLMSAQFNANQQFKAVFTHLEPAVLNV